MPRDQIQHITDAQINLKKNWFGTSLVVQWLRICLALQGTRVQSPGQGNEITPAEEQLSPRATTTEPMCHSQREAQAWQQRSHVQQLRPEAAKLINWRKMRRQREQDNEHTHRLNFTNKEMQIKIKYDLCILTKMKRVDNTPHWWGFEFSRHSQIQSLRGLTWHNS